MVQTADNQAVQGEKQQPMHTEDDEINLMDLMLVLAKHNRFILKFTIVVALISVVAALLLPNIYTAKTVITVLPPLQQPSSGANPLLGQFDAMASLAGGALGLKNPSDLFVGTLKSNTIADALIQQYKLQTLYGTKSMAGTRTKLADASSISTDKYGFISIEFSNKDPKLAAAIANAYVDNLSRLSQTLAISEAAQRGLFLEKQIKITNDNLGFAELALKNISDKTALIQINKQRAAVINAVANLRAQITAHEVQLATMRSFITNRDSDYIKTEQTLVDRSNNKITE